jgi:hypothetical protein
MQFLFDKMKLMLYYSLFEIDVHLIHLDAFNVPIR